MRMLITLLLSALVSASASALVNEQYNPKDNGMLVSEQRYIDVMHKLHLMENVVDPNGNKIPDTVPNWQPSKNYLGFKRP